MGDHIFMDYFPQTSPIISGSFVERDLPVKASCASSPPYTVVGRLWSITVCGVYGVEFSNMKRVRQTECDEMMVRVIQ